MKESSSTTRYHHRQSGSTAYRLQARPVPTGRGLRLTAMPRPNLPFNGRFFRFTGDRHWLASLCTMQSCVAIGMQLASATGASTFSRRHPLASWVASMLLCFAGEIFSAAVVGDALLVPLTTCGNCVLSASLVWSVLRICYCTAH